MRQIHGLEANCVGADKGNFLLNRAFTKATGSSVKQRRLGVRRKAHDIYLAVWIIHVDDKVMMVIKTTIYFGRFRCRR